jgi:hypothetical protein
MTSRVDHKALRELCRLLVNALQNSYCVLTQIGLFDAVNNMAGQDWGTDPAARKILEAAYSTCFEWLTRARSDAELEELQESACHCTGKLLHSAHERMHALGGLAFERHSSSAWSMVLTWTVHPFDQGSSPVGLNVDMMHQLSRRTGWPRSITSMLPHGPERTIQALLRLFRTVIPGQRRALYAALEWIMALCHPLVTRLLIRSSAFLRYGIGGFTDMPIPIPSNIKSSAVRDASIVSEVERFTRLMMRYVYFSLNETERLVFESQEPETLLWAYTRCLQICESALKLTELPMHQRWFSDVGLSSKRIENTELSLFCLSTRLCEDCPSLRGTHVPAHIWDRILHDTASLRQTPSSHMVEKRVQLAVHHLEVRQRCTALGCIRTRADGRLRRCGQCKRVPYCSRACQKAAWAHAIAHRNVCKSIAFLCNVYGTPERDVYNYTQTSEPGNDASYEEMGLQVLDHFTRLTKLNMATPGSTSTYPLHAYLR